MSEECFTSEQVEVRGAGEIAAPIQDFDDLLLDSTLRDNLRRCKFARPMLVQQYALPICLSARDIMACAQTGSGKTAAFCLPIVQGLLSVVSRKGRSRRRVTLPLALVLAPTRELAQQIADEAVKFCYQTGVTVGVVYGGTPIWHTSLEKADILVATPGRLCDLLNRRMVDLQHVQYLTLDEADRMLDMGFEPQIRRIVQESSMPGVARRQTLMFSATFPQMIQKLAEDFLREDYVFLAIGDVGASTSRIKQDIIFVSQSQKYECLKRLIDRQQKTQIRLGKEKILLFLFLFFLFVKKSLFFFVFSYLFSGQKTLVFVGRKLKADDLVVWLRSNGHIATPIHGDKTQDERSRALRSFKSGSAPILVATDVASRGIDIPDVSHVVNFDLPSNIDDYVHRIGRTGRAGKCGSSTSLFSDGDNPRAHKLVQMLHSCGQQVPDWLIHKATAVGTQRDHNYSRYGK